MTTFPKLKSKTISNKARRNLILCLIVTAISLTFYTINAYSDTYQVIVNKSNPTASLDKGKAAALFLKKEEKWQHKENISPIFIVSSNPAFEHCPLKLVDQSAIEWERYWVQKKYTEGAATPTEAFNEGDIVKFVAQNPGAIGCVKKGAEGDGVKVVLSLDL